MNQILVQCTYTTLPINKCGEIISICINVGSRLIDYKSFFWSVNRLGFLNRFQPQVLATKIKCIRYIPLNMSFVRDFNTYSS